MKPNWVLTEHEGTEVFCMKKCRVTDECPKDHYCSTKEGGFCIPPCQIPNNGVITYQNQSRYSHMISKRAAYDQNLPPEPYTSNPYTPQPYKPDHYTTDHTTKPYKPVPFTSKPFKLEPFTFDPYQSEQDPTQPYKHIPYSTDPYTTNPIPYTSEPYKPQPATLTCDKGYVLADNLEGKTVSVSCKFYPRDGTHWRPETQVGEYSSKAICKRGTNIHGISAQLSSFLL